MSTLIATTGAFVAAGVLTFSAGSHLRHFAAFIGLLERQEIWGQAARSVGALVVAAEAGVGLLAGTLLLVGQPSRLRLALAAATAVYLAYAGFNGWLLAHRPAAPCACATSEHPISIWAVIRALSLGACALSGLIGASSIATPARGAQFLVPLLAALTIGSLLWVLPAAMHDPSGKLRPPHLTPENL
jgi:hypothetical protein